MDEVSYRYLIKEFGEEITDYLDKVIWIDKKNCIVEDFGFVVATSSSA